MDDLIKDAFEVIQSKTSSKSARCAAVNLLISALTSFLPKEDEECNLENRIKFNLFLTKSDDSFRLQDSARILRGGRRVDSVTETIQNTISGLVLSSEFKIVCVFDYILIKISLFFNLCISLQIPYSEEKTKSTLSVLINHFILIDCSIYASPIGQPLATDGATDQNVQLVRIVDAILTVFTLQESNIEKISTGVFDLISVAFETAKGLLNDANKAAKLPFFVIFAKKICEGCFQRAWFAKSSARHVITKLIDYMPSVWICEHGYDFFHALIFIIRDLADEGRV